MLFIFENVNALNQSHTHNWIMATPFQSKSQIHKVPNPPSPKPTKIPIYDKVPATYETNLHHLTSIALYRLRLLSCAEVASMNEADDILSHYICRLAFCDDDQKRKWFVKQEVALFEHRYSSASLYDQHRTERLLFTPSFPTMSASDFIQLDLNGRAPIPMIQFDNVHPKEIHRKYFPIHLVPFDLVSFKLLSLRKVYLQDGYAVIPHMFFSNILGTEYRRRLYPEMMKAKGSLLTMKSQSPTKHQLQKILHLIDALPALVPSLQTDSNDNHARIDAAIQYFPLCMQYLHRSLLTKGHLSNSHRVQYILYLKAIGVSFAECLSLFKKHFTQNESNFVINLRYYIEYYFVKKDYRPWSCTRCISRGLCPFSANSMLSLFAKSIIQKQYGNGLNVEESMSCKSLFRSLIGSKGQIQCVEDIEDLPFIFQAPHLYFKHLSKFSTKKTPNIITDPEAAFKYTGLN